MDLCRAEQELEALVGIVRDVDTTAVDVEQLGVLLLAGEDAFEAAERVQVVALDRERTLVELDGLAAVAEAVLVATRDFGRQLVGQLLVELGLAC